MIFGVSCIILYVHLVSNLCELCLKVTKNMHEINFIHIFFGIITALRRVHNMTQDVALRCVALHCDALRCVRAFTISRWQQLTVCSNGKR